jgi:hypothetical protein
VIGTGLRFGYGLVVSYDWFGVSSGAASLAFKLSLQLALGLGPPFFQTGLFFLTFVKSYAWSW